MDIDEAALDAAVQRNRFTGVVTLDVGAERRFERSFGFAHRAHGIANSPATKFALASGGKSFTALAILRLVEAGSLRLDDPVRSFLGDDLPLIDDGVTIEQLLTHTSGIGDYLDEEGDWEVDDYVMPVPVHTLAETAGFLACLDGFPQKFPPGERFGYCNGGYVVLAIVIERVSGRGYHEFVEQEVCARAGLRNTGFPRSDDLPGDAALGYLDPEGDRSNVLHLPVRGTGDGGIYSTADDLHRFWSQLHAGAIVSPSVVEAMTAPRVDVPDEGMRYGMGFWLHATAPVVAMEGYDAGVSIRSMHDPATDATLSVLGNSSEGAWPVISAVEDVLAD